FIHGIGKPDSYRFHHWQIIDTFVYYSRHLVTIPPPGWITAAHRHGVKVLGTFMLESRQGLKILNKIESSNLSCKVASQLARVAALSRFDGWLIRMGENMGKCPGHVLRHLLTAITSETHRYVPDSLVIWHDDVLSDGRVKAQNELNGSNMCFFNLCDGMLLSFDWNENKLRNSAIVAGRRKSDVYVAIDVYARDKCYSGGYDTRKAVEIVRGYGLSAAIFRASWVYETQNKKAFAENQCLLWTFPDQCCSEWRLSTLPLATTFCQGFGYKLYREGQVVKPSAWFNLSKQQLQPRDQGSSLCGGNGSAMVHTAEAYDGGGCLWLQFNPNRVPLSNVEPYFRLFGCDFPLGSLTVSYTYKNKDPCSLAGQDFALTLKVRRAAGKTEVLSLGTTIAVPPHGNYMVEFDITTNADGDPGPAKHLWTTRTYRVKDNMKGVGGAIVEEIGVTLGLNKLGSFLLGELVVERPEDKMARNQAMKRKLDDCSSDSGPSSEEEDDGKSEATL
ncbi:hypothetical protein V5799_013002, partial [Amblyomma americanum]